jgi:tripartite-type tricarboxylate transporter receptor subunit TctC
MNQHAKPLATAAAAIALLMTAIFSFPASAGDFYKGKQVELSAGSKAGGGYDAYARLLGRHISHHIPGAPTIIVRNMPGAGGMTQANYLYNTAPRDGLAFGILQNTLPINQLAKSEAVKFDMRKFSWVGNMNVMTTICVFNRQTKLKSAKDMQTRKILVGAATNTSTSMIPQILNSLVGTKFEIVRGYEGTNPIVLAMERKEVSGLCGWGWDSAQVQAHDAIEKGDLTVGIDIANEPHPDLQKRGVPFVMDMLPDGENKRVLRLVLSTQYYGRPFAAPPGVPQDRLAVLREGFAATMKDAKFLAEAKKMNIEIRYLSPEQIVGAIKAMYEEPKKIQERALNELRKAGWSGL